MATEQCRLVLPLVGHSPMSRRPLWHHCGPGAGGGRTGAGSTGGAGTGTRTGGGTRGGSGA